MNNLINKIKSFSGILKYIYRENKKSIKNTESYNFSKNEKIYLSEMQKNGFVVIENFIEREKCIRIIKKIDEILKNIQKKYGAMKFHQIVEF